MFSPRFESASFEFSSETNRNVKATPSFFDHPMVGMLATQKGATVCSTKAKLLYRRKFEGLEKIATHCILSFSSSAARLPITVIIIVENGERLQGPAEILFNSTRFAPSEGVCTYMFALI